MVKSKQVKDADCVTGVMYANYPIWLWDMDYIDLMFEEAIQELKDQGRTEDEIYDELEYFESSGGRQLYGAWIQTEDGMFDIDKNSKRDFAAIYNSNENTIQVVWSKYYKLCNWASPCYPHQGDLESDGDVPAYVLPDDMFDKSMLDKESRAFVKAIKKVKA